MVKFTCADSYPAKVLLQKSSGNIPNLWECSQHIPPPLLTGHICAIGNLYIGGQCSYFARKLIIQYGTGIGTIEENSIMGTR